MAQGTPEEVKRSSDPLVHQFVTAAPDGPVRFQYPAPSFADDLGLPANPLFSSEQQMHNALQASGASLSPHSPNAQGERA